MVRWSIWSGKNRRSPPQFGMELSKELLSKTDGARDVLFFVLPFLVCGFLIFLAAARKPVDGVAPSLRYLLLISFAVGLFWWGTRCGGDCWDVSRPDAGPRASSVASVSGMRVAKRRTCSSISRRPEDLKVVLIQVGNGYVGLFLRHDVQLYQPRRGTDHRVLLRRLGEGHRSSRCEESHSALSLDQETVQR